MTTACAASANPTLAVLSKTAQALQVSIEELIGAPRHEVQHIRAGDVRIRRRQGARIRPLAVGDMLVFRGDQRHSYRNPDGGTVAVGISVVLFAGK